VGLFSQIQRFPGTKTELRMMSSSKMKSVSKVMVFSATQKRRYVSLELHYMLLNINLDELQIIAE